MAEPNMVAEGAVGGMRQFESGATRSPDHDRYDPEGFLSPMVIERFSQYMHKHRFQADGNVRDSDNWQKGLPVHVWMKGMWRHFLHLWTRHRGMPVQDPKAGTDMEEDLCAILFNAQGYLHELLKQRYAKSCAEPVYPCAPEPCGDHAGKGGNYTCSKCEWFVL